MKKLILAALLATAAVGGAASTASAQRITIQSGPPVGWVGPHYYWGGRHWHNREWACGPYHRGCHWRYW